MAHKLPVTEVWLREVRAKIDALPDGTRSRIAEELDVSRSYVTHLLAGRVRSSPHVEAISRYLGIPPSFYATDELSREWTALFHQLTETSRRQLLSVARTYLRADGIELPDDLERPEKQPGPTRKKRR